ncbi:MAG: glutamate/gamma-aminobutyrate family transporter YjeM [Bacillota bacterium]|nr:glutamate/gamma-aminobutyrate family transporter YjeM [Bacillota bacterium]
MPNGDLSKKLTLPTLILMIFTSVFGFTNIPRSFYLMGYSAIPWYILSALTFFIPFAFMMAEYGSAFKNEKGGIYSWMSRSVGPRYAFIGTFMWYASYIIWMVNISSVIWIPLSNGIFGRDTTSTWSLLGLNSTQTLGLLGILWILAVTYIASRGLRQITKITSVGGTAVAVLNIVLLVGALLVFAASGGSVAEPITSGSFVSSPNPGYYSLLSVFSFLVFAVFAYGGIEVAAGLVDETEHPERNYPRGITIAAVIIAVGYSLGIFLCGIFTNWSGTLSGKDVHMGNVAYVLMKNLGYQIGVSFGLSGAVSITVGEWVARLVGLSMFLALTGAFFTLTYAPLKQIIEGTPSGLWPGRFGEVKDGIPSFGMWVQCIVVILFILLLTFGGEAAAQFFNKLILMTNVAMTVPYLFISGAFAAFKKKNDIQKPFEIFKSYSSSLAAAVIVTLTVGFANVFTIIEPATKGDLSSTIWMLVGPIIFSIAAVIMYSSYERKNK